VPARSKLRFGNNLQEHWGRFLFIDAAAHLERFGEHLQFRQEQCKIKIAGPFDASFTRRPSSLLVPVRLLSSREGRGLTLPSSGPAYGGPLKSNVRALAVGTLHRRPSVPRRVYVHGVARHSVHASTSTVAERCAPMQRTISFAAKPDCDATRRVRSAPHS